MNLAGQLRRLEQFISRHVTDLRRRPEIFGVVGYDEVSSIVGGLLDGSEVVTDTDLTSALADLWPPGPCPRCHPGLTVPTPGKARPT